MINKSQFNVFSTSKKITQKHFKINRESTKNIEDKELKTFKIH